MLNKVFIAEPLESSIDPPGTCLFDPPEQDETEEAIALKRHPKNHHIILRPQPTDSPLDPLNWSTLRKEAMFWTLLVGSVCTGVIGPIIVPAFPTVAAAFNEPVAKIAQLNGVLVLFEGVAGVIFTVTSAFWGRRHTYLLCTIFQFVGCIWGATAQSYGSMYGARVLMGMGMAACAVALGSTITDCFFSYELGVKVALWQVTYVAAVNVAPIISGIITTNLGWRYCFWVLAAFQGAVLIAVILLCPETKYKPRSLPIKPFSNLEAKRLEEQLEHKEKSSTFTSPEAATPLRVEEERLTFLSTLKFWGQRYDTESIWITIFRPVCVVFTPHIFWATIAYTLSFNWYVTTGAVYGQIYSGQYYDVSVKTNGYLAGVAPLIGTLASCLAFGPITDFSARWLSVKVHGTFEPEYRLVSLAPAIVFTAIGGFGWALTVGPEWHYLVSTSLAGFLFAGATLGLCSVVAYANSCYPSQGGDTFAIMLLIRSSFIFGATYYLNNWLLVNGVKQFFCVWTGIAIGVYALGLPVYIYGKRMRAACARSKILGWAAS
ncbi:MFS general substrate transporter [Meredithblackwellia eburnea MCA 4105]